MAFDFPATPTLGDEFTPLGGPTYIWQPPIWMLKAIPSGNVIIADVAPTGIEEGQLWWESDTGTLFVYYDDGNSLQWVQAAGAAGGGAAPIDAYTKVESDTLFVDNIVQTLVTISSPYTKPIGLKFLEVEVQAGGGGGGGCTAATASTHSAGSGGGGGAWCRDLFDAASIPASVAMTIGAAGVGVWNANGTVGGATSFGTLLVVAGGNPGILLAPSAVAAFVYGGAGGAVTTPPSAGPSRVGDTGGNATIWDAATVVISGGGGNSMYGSGGLTLQCQKGSLGSDGGAGSGWGAGGGGAINGANAVPGDNGLNRTGGAGTAGCIILKEYF